MFLMPQAFKMVVVNTVWMNADVIAEHYVTYGQKQNRLLVRLMFSHQNILVVVILQEEKYDEYQE